MRSRYSRWSGGQDPLGERLDAGDLLERIGDELLAGFGARGAIDRLRREGLSGRGLDALQRALRQRRERMTAQLDLDGPLAWLSDELDAVVADERRELAGRVGDGARFAEMRLDALPRDPAGRFKTLADYDFASAAARERYDQIAERLRKDVLDAYLRDLSGALGTVTPEDVQRLTAMLADLNDMLEARERGEEPDFDGFMAKHGDLFPERPGNLDELLEVLARRAMAMAQLMAAMTPDQRRQLSELASAVFDDLDLQFQLAQLQDNLASALAGMDLSGMRPPEPRQGEPSGPLSGLVDAMERIGEIEDLEQQLAGDYAGATLDDIDEDALRRHLGDDAVRDLGELKRIEDELERAGLVDRRDGKLELTPRGARLLGERALTKLLERVRREPSTRTQGADPEPTGQTRAWAFGDSEPLAVQRTVANAVMRTAAEGRSPSGRVAGGAEARRDRSSRGEHARRPLVTLAPDDLEVMETEVRPRTATALLLDLSFSMPLQGHFVPAKRMALALHALIEGKHRQDSLYLIGFSDYARRMQPTDLAAAGFERVYGTNMQHAFLLARRVLADDPRPVKQVIMVTDGEPTAHLEGDQAVFNWPPVAETLEKTLREAMRLARLNISLDIFLLEDAPGLLAFAERLARLTGGEVFRMSAEDVGHAVVTGY